VDDDNTPFYNIRILHTVVLEDPFDDEKEETRIAELEP
jgi:hypothetical protein